MTHETYDLDLSDLGAPYTLGTRDYLEDAVSREAYPVIYIDSAQELRYLNGIIYYNDITYPVAGKTLLTVVLELQALGISAYLVSDTVAIIPAELLVPYRSHDTGTLDVDSSPMSLTSMHTPNILNVLGLDEANIERNILSVHSRQRANDDTERDGYLDFSTSGGNLFVNNLPTDATCLYEYNTTRFFLYASSKAVIDVHSMVSHDTHSSASQMLIDSMNSINTDQL